MKYFLLMFMLLGLFSVSCFAQTDSEQPPDIPIDATTQTQIADAVLKEINALYVFPEVAQKMDADIRARLKNNEYAQISSAREFAKKLTEDLRSVSRDKHLGVIYSYNSIPVRAQQNQPTTEERQRNEMMMRLNNYAFAKAEVMPGNVGYIDLRGFTDSALGAETVAAAMNFINNSDALIFDLRQNGGGQAEMVALISSYLFNEKTHLNDLYMREGNQTEESWTNPQVSGKKYLGKDVYVLTSNKTFSAAEEFANDLKVLKRATIVGETTGGGANPNRFVRLADHFMLSVSIGRAINPVTKTNWEGTGVEPDVKVNKEVALKTAYLLALQKQAGKMTDERLKVALTRLIARTEQEIEALNKDVKN